MTPPLDIAAIRKRLEAATPGEWEAHQGLDYVKITSPQGDVAEWSTYGEEAQPFMNPDADLIAHAPTDIANLLSEVEALREAIIDAPIISKYHGRQGFERERFIADYFSWFSRARTALTQEGE